MTWDKSKTRDGSGALQDFWMRFPGLRGASDQDAGGNDVIYYLESPFFENMVILEALATITTLDAQDADIDIGIVDDAAGTDSLTGVAVICDSLVNTAAGVFRVMTPEAVAGTTAAPIWKAKGTAAGSFLSIKQNGDVDAAALRWNLAIRVIPYNDLLNADVELGAIAVA
jgi:hypothetical protein